MKIKKLISLMLVYCLGVSMVFSASQQSVFASSLSERRLILVPKESYQLKVLGVKGKVRWTSSNRKVATVSQKGKVVGKSSGTAWITGTNKKQKYQCKVIVIKNWSRKELRALINANVLKKEEVLDLIRKHSLSKLSVYPDAAFEWKVDSYPIQISSISLTSRENDFTEIAKASKAKKTFKKYSIIASVKGHAPLSLGGQKISIYFSNEKDTVLNSISGWIQSDGTIDFTDQYLLNTLTEQIVSNIEITYPSSSNGGNGFHGTEGGSNDSEKPQEPQKPEDSEEIEEPVSSPDQFEYVTGEDAVAIIKYVGHGKNIVIPELIEDLPVKFIASNAFRSNVQPLEVEHIVIPKSVEAIGNNAFQNCSNLQSVKIASGSALKTINDFVFNGCNQLKEINLPDTVETIGKLAFDRCNSLTSISIENVKTLDSYAFSDTGLTAIFIPVINLNSQQMNINMFENCSDLKKVVLASGNIKVFSGMFSNCNSLTEISLPDTIKVIESGAFFGCSHLSKVELSEGVERIEANAFGNCFSLLELTLPQSITAISDDAFDGCYFITLKGQAGSYAEEYAKQHHIKFIPILNN